MYADRESVLQLGFDDAFTRLWNFYLCYCEAGFATQTLGLQVLTFTRPNNTSLITGRPAGRVCEAIGPFVGGGGGAVVVAAGSLD